MSDQNPPTTSGPEEPTPSGVPPTHTEVGQRAPRRTGPSRMVTIVAALVVLVLVVAGLGAFFLLRNRSHEIVTPSHAGSMKRDTDREKALSTQLSQAEAQLKKQGQNQCASIKYVKSAVYDQADAKRGPKGALVFLGAKLSKEQKPSRWTACFSKLAKGNGLTVRSIDAGSDDVKAVCASVTAPQKLAICGWATRDTIGELLPTIPGYDAKLLSKITLALRDDVEKSQ